MLKVEMEVKIDGFNVGTVVSLHYKVDADTKKVVMNFLSGQSGSADSIFHFNPRYHKEQALVLNTRKGVSGWEKEERPSGFPIEIDKEVHVTIEAESDGFLIKCDGHSFQYKFNYRGMPVTNIHHIAISYGTLRIKNASYLGIVNPQSNKSIKDGDCVILPVSVIQSGPQLLSFKWKKDNGDLTDTSKYAGVDESNLKISSFSAKEQGKYSCIVSNGRWSVESGSAELELATDKPPLQEQKLPPKPAQEEEIAEAPSGAPVLSMAKLSLLKGKGKEVEIIKAVTPNWIAFGLHLDFDPVGCDLETIEKRNNKDPADSCKDMFQHWLKGNGVKATWDNVIEFLDAVGLKVLANDVRAIIY